jgi:MraZ protein
MSYFSSEYECKLDAKGRMVLPARIKSSMPEDSEGTRIVLTRGFEPCITIYPIDEWQKIFERVASLDEFNPEYRRFQRNFLRGNTEVELDKNGRFILPRTMARYAKIERDAILVGMGNRIEVWNPEVYDEYLINDQEEFSALALRFLSKEDESSKKETMPKKAVVMAKETIKEEDQPLADDEEEVVIVKTVKKRVPKKVAQPIEVVVEVEIIEEEEDEDSTDV